MYPHERSLVRLLAGKSFAIVGVNSDQKIETAINAVKTKNLNWRSFVNQQGEGSISGDWKVNSWPTTYLIDAKGIIRYKGLRGNSLDKAVEELLAELGEEVSIVGVDHEAEDEKAMEAFLKEAESAAE